VEISSRKDAIILAQLRSGHSNLLRAYRHVIDPLVDPTCPKCVEGQHTLEHWLTECPCSGNYPATSHWVHRCISEPALSRTSQVRHTDKEVSLEAPLACMLAHTITTTTAVSITRMSNHFGSCSSRRQCGNWW